MRQTPCLLSLLTRALRSASTIRSWLRQEDLVPTVERDSEDPVCSCHGREELSQDPHWKAEIPESPDITDDDGFASAVKKALLYTHIGDELYDFHMAAAIAAAVLWTSLVFSSRQPHLKLFVMTWILFSRIPGHFSNSRHIF